METQFLKRKVKKLKTREKQLKYGRKEVEESGFKIRNLIKMNIAKDLKLHFNQAKRVEATVSLSQFTQLMIWIHHLKQSNPRIIYKKKYNQIFLRLLKIIKNILMKSF